MRSCDCRSCNVREHAHWKTWRWQKWWNVNSYTKSIFESIRIITRTESLLRDLNKWRPTGACERWANSVTFALVRLGVKTASPTGFRVTVFPEWTPALATNMRNMIIIGFTRHGFISPPRFQASSWLHLISHGHGWPSIEWYSEMIQMLIFSTTHAAFFIYTNNK